MSIPVAYDLSRLLLRSFESGPNGIDRVDLNLGRHFLGAGAADNCGIVLNRLRPMVVGRRAAASFLDRVDEAWRDSLAPDDDPAFQALRRRLIRLDGPATALDASRIVRPAVPRPVTAWRLASLLLPQLALLKPVPKDAVFLHVTQFPAMNLFDWLDRRADVKPVFFVHDLLPLQFPDFFTEQNARWHRQFLDVLVRFGRAAIVNTEAVKKDLVAFLQSRGATPIKIQVAPMPSAPVFAQGLGPDAELRQRPYFVICGTIEPRKNHMLLLKVWRELARSEGANAPALVIIGRRGWSNEEVFKLLDLAERETPQIVEVAGLTSNAMREIMANARALLMPSYGEGYGLPLVEARAAGAPIIASDIEVFREVGGDRFTYCPIDDTEAWLAAIKRHIAGDTQRGHAAMTPAENQAAWSGYVRTVSDFIGTV